MNPKLFEVLRERQAELESGVILIVEDARYRLRRLPLSPAVGSGR